jgi:hypothetical protein
VQIPGSTRRGSQSNVAAAPSHFERASQHVSHRLLIIDEEKLGFKKQLRDAGIGTKTHPSNRPRVNAPRQRPLPLGQVRVPRLAHLCSKACCHAEMPICFNPLSGLVHEGREARRKEKNMQPQQAGVFGYQVRSIAGPLRVERKYRAMMMDQSLFRRMPFVS